MTSSEVFFHDSTTCMNRLIFFLLLSNVLLLLKFKLPPFFHLHASHIPIFCWTLLTTSLLRHMCGCVFLYHLWAIFTSTLSPSPFFTPKIYAQPMNTITVHQRCVCVAVYFAYSSLFLLLSLCHNVSCVLPMPKEHRLYTVLLLPTLDNPNDNIFWSQKSTEHRRDNTYEKLLQNFSYLNKKRYKLLFKFIYSIIWQILK